MMENKSRLPTFTNSSQHNIGLVTAIRQDQHITNHLYFYILTMNMQKPKLKVITFAKNIIYHSPMKMSCLSMNQKFIYTDLYAHLTKC